MERAYPGQYWNPARWRTPDGYMPIGVFQLYAEALFPMFALDRLNFSAAIGLAFAGKETGDRLREKAVAEAYPEAYPGEGG